jgi:hypothetical protein
VNKPALRTAAGLPSAPRSCAGILLAASSVFTLGACEELLKSVSPDKHVDPHVDCSGPDCVCSGGFGDCDNNVDNGCETDLNASPNCGACGVACINAVCTNLTCECKSGFGDCDGNKANGCETSLAQDSRNCGACNHDCGSGGCIGGVCLPATIAGVPSGVDALAADTGKVYVGSCGTTGPSVESFMLPVSAPKTLAGPGCVKAIAAAGGVSVWATDTSIVTGANVTLANGVKTTNLLAVGSDAVYWYDAATMALYRATITGGTPDTVATGTITGLAADFVNGYWSDANGIHSIAHTATMPLTLNAVVQGNVVAADGFNVYAVDASGIEAIPKNGGMATLLVPTDQVLSVAADGSSVFFSRADGTLQTVSTNGGTPTMLVSGEKFAQGVPLALDAQAVFWISAGSLRTIGK